MHSTVRRLCVSGQRPPIILAPCKTAMLVKALVHGDLFSTSSRFLYSETLAKVLTRLGADIPCPHMSNFIRLAIQVSIPRSSKNFESSYPVYTPGSSPVKLVVHPAGSCSSPSPSTGSLPEAISPSADETYDMDPMDDRRHPSKAGLPTIAREAQSTALHRPTAHPS